MASLLIWLIAGWIIGWVASMMMRTDAQEKLSYVRITTY